MVLVILGSLEQNEQNSIFTIDIEPLIISGCQCSRDLQYNDFPTLKSKERHGDDKAQHSGVESASAKAAWLRRHLAAVS